MNEIEMRNGIGYDIHPLIEGRDLYLGGVKFDYERGLDGHSDADVLLHAVCDALLGAACLGDIGINFPNTDMNFKNISSLKLLKLVKQMLDTENWIIVNIDVSLIAEKPIISPYIPDMKKNMANELNITVNRINIKATTNEKLGALGRGEGIACFAISTIKRP